MLIVVVLLFIPMSSNIHYESVAIRPKIIEVIEREGNVLCL